MDIERKFEDLGVDAITGLQLMKSLGLYPDDFYDEARFLRFKDIIDYFKDIPDRDYLFNKITIGKNVDKLDHVWGYTQLAQQKDKIRKNIDGDMTKLKTLEDLGDEMSHDNIKFLQSNIVDKRVELSRIDGQIDKYES